MDFRDQLSRTISLERAPRRIVSLVPSQTELLVSLGLEKELLGITAYCEQPAHLLSQKVVVGGTKDVSFDKVAKLKPDLIIANKEENIPQQIAKLEEVAPVWVSDVRTVEAALAMIKGIAHICRRKTAGDLLTDSIREGFAQLPQLQRPLRYLYFIWKDPYMAASADTYLSDLLARVGLQNVITQSESRYPELSAAEIAASEADIIFLSSEPYAFRTADLHEMSELTDNPHLRIINTQNISWYGSRIIAAQSTLAHIINDLNIRFQV